MDESTYEIQPVKRMSLEGKMVFGKWTTGKERTVAWDLLRNGRAVCQYRTKREALAGLTRRTQES